MISLWSRYVVAIKRRPLAVKSITSAVVIGASDVTSQYMCRHNSTTGWFDPKLTFASAFLYGACFFTPLMHNVFRLWSIVYPSTALHAVVFKSCVDCVTSFPLNISMLISSRAVVTGANPREALKESFRPSLIAGWTFWPLYTVFLYKFVPEIFRIGMINIASYGWNLWLISSTSKRNEFNSKFES